MLKVPVEVRKIEERDKLSDPVEVQQTSNEISTKGKKGCTTKPKREKHNETATTMKRLHNNAATQQKKGNTAAQESSNKQNRPHHSHLAMLKTRQLLLRRDLGLPHFAQGHALHPKAHVQKPHD